MVSKKSNQGKKASGSAPRPPRIRGRYVVSSALVPYQRPGAPPRCPASPSLSPPPPPAPPSPSPPPFRRPLLLLPPPPVTPPRRLVPVVELDRTDHNRLAHYRSISDPVDRRRRDGGRRAAHGMLGAEGYVLATYPEAEHRIPPCDRCRRHRRRCFGPPGKPFQRCYNCASMDCSHKSTVAARKQGIRPQYDPLGLFGARREEEDEEEEEEEEDEEEEEEEGGGESPHTPTHRLSRPSISSPLTPGMMREVVALVTRYDNEADPMIRELIVDRLRLLAAQAGETVLSLTGREFGEVRVAGGSGAGRNPGYDRS